MISVEIHLNYNSNLKNKVTNKCIEK